MPTRIRIILNKEELARADIPTNHVLIEMQYRSEDLKTLAGIHVGFNSEETFAESESSHVADVAETWGVVTKVPQKLFFDKDDPKSMDWDCAMELQVGDLVWFSILESKNAYEVECEGKVYRSIPYADCYVVKREPDDITDCPALMGLDMSKIGREVSPKELLQLTTTCLNGYVLVKPAYLPKLSHLDAFSDTQIDKTRGTIAFIGKPVRAYLRSEYNDIDDLRVGDEVLFAPKTPLFFLERMKETACFNNGEQYWVILRRRIAMVINRNNG